MITIKLGRIFLDKYNLENKTSFTPKECWTDIIAPLIMGRKEGKCFTDFFNTAVHPKYLNPGFKKTKNPNEFITNQIQLFCNQLESEETLRMSYLNVFGGGGCSISPSSFCTNDNYFTLDECYLSFIGYLFTINLNGIAFAFYNKDLVWELWSGLNIYRQLLDNNDSLQGGQCQTWNNLWLQYRLNSPKEKLMILGERINNDVKKQNDKYGEKFTNQTFLPLFLRIIMEYPVSYLIAKNYGQTNTTYPPILIKTDFTKEIYEQLQSLYIKVHGEFNIAEFNSFIEKKIFKFKEIFEIILQNGTLEENILHPFIMLLEKSPKEQYKKELIKKYITMVVKDTAIKILTSTAEMFKETLNASVNNHKTLANSFIEKKQKVDFMDAFMKAMLQLEVDKTKFKEFKDLILFSTEEEFALYRVYFKYELLETIN